MKALTSISPKHANEGAQALAMRSWIEHGVNPVSFNTPEEIEALRASYDGVEFVSTGRSGKGIHKAPYALISSMIDYAEQCKYEHAFIVNSDITISDPGSKLAGYFEASANGLVFANRYDHNGDLQNPTRYDYGFDAFIIHRNYFGILPQTLFAMGQTWWDYWIPYRFIKSGIPIQLVKEPIFMHHRHKVQYDQKEWERMTEHFVWVERYQSVRRGPQQTTNEVYRLIRQHAR